MLHQNAPKSKGVTYKKKRANLSIFMTWALRRHRDRKKGPSKASCKRRKKRWTLKFETKPKVPKEDSRFRSRLRNISISSDNDDDDDGGHHHWEGDQTQTKKRRRDPPRVIILHSNKNWRQEIANYTCMHTHRAAPHVVSSSPVIGVDLGCVFFCFSPRAFGFKGFCFRSSIRRLSSWGFGILGFAKQILSSQLHVCVFFSEVLLRFWFRFISLHHHHKSWCQHRKPLYGATARNPYGTHTHTQTVRRLNPKPPTPR